MDSISFFLDAHRGIQLAGSEVRFTHRSELKIKILHLIAGLDTGGAEMMLYKLLSGLDKEHFYAEVISLTDIGSVGQRILDLGVPVVALGMRRGLPNPMALLRLTSILRERNPDFLQTWMYHADLLGGIAAKFARNLPVIWGIRQSDFDPVTSRRMTMFVAKVCATFSRVLPEQIICCSHAAYRAHVKLGYDETKMKVIPNGFDLTKFRINPIARNTTRSEIGVPNGSPLIGLVARFDPMKDHQNFIAAAARIQKALPAARFVMYGDGVTRANKVLTEWIDSSGLETVCTLLGRRDDMENVYPALDVLALSSYGEGFPNVLGEAMACGVPCVATDVGDSSQIVGDTGLIVPPRHPERLADAVVELLEKSDVLRRDLSDAARERVVTHFSLPSIVAQYQTLYTDLFTKRAGKKCAA